MLEQHDTLISKTFFSVMVSLASSSRTDSNMSPIFAPAAIRSWADVTLVAEPSYVIGLHELYQDLSQRLLALPSTLGRRAW